MDPENARIIAAHLADAFANLDPGSGEAYQANAKKFTGRIGRQIGRMARKLAPFKGAKVVSYHNSWPYFAQCFGLEMDLFLEPKPGIPPSPAHLAEVIAQMKEQHARVIIVDPYLGRKTAETVARRHDAVVVDVAQMPGAIKGTDSYIELLDYLVSSIATALQQK